MASGLFLHSPETANTCMWQIAQRFCLIFEGKSKDENIHAAKALPPCVRLIQAKLIAAPKDSAMSSSIAT